MAINKRITGQKSKMSQTAISLQNPPLITNASEDTALFPLSPQVVTKRISKPFYFLCLNRKNILLGLTRTQSTHFMIQPVVYVLMEAAMTYVSMLGAIKARVLIQTLDIVSIVVPEHMDSRMQR